MPGPWHRPALRALAGAVLFVLPLCACAPSRLDVIQVGPWFSARPAREVEVFASREATRVQWGAIGIIHGPLTPAGSKKLEKQKRQARAAAARMGADGLILVVDSAADDSQLSELREPEVYLSGLAIKYDAKASTSPAK